MKDDNGNDIIGKFDANVWNHIELELQEKELHLIFNGEDKGKIWTYENNPSGTVRFCAGTGTMIKDISIS